MGGACPRRIACTSLIVATVGFVRKNVAGRAVTGRAAVKVEAGKTTVIEIPLPKSASS